MKILLLPLIGFATAQAQTWKSLLDENLSDWTVWTGYPHPSLEMDWDGKDKGRPMGDGDPLGIFEAETDDEGVVTLKITGKASAALISKNKFSKYHFKTEMKWGDDKWEPRLSLPRDSGIIYHSQDGRPVMQKAWRPGLEFQVMRCEMGGYFRVGDVSVQARPNSETSRRPRFSPSAMWKEIKAPNYCCCSQVDMEKKGDWNQFEIIVDGSRSVHIVNGTVVNVLRRAEIQGSDGVAKPLKTGRIQIQAHGADLSYRNMKMQEISRMPLPYLKYFREPSAE